MPITKVIYERLYPIGSYLNERIGVEISLTEGQDAMQALHEAKKLTDQFNLEANPHLQSGPQPQELEVLPEMQVLKSNTDHMIDDIYKCETWAELKSYELMSKGNDRLKIAFDNRKKELGVIG